MRSRNLWLIPLALSSTLVSAQSKPPASAVPDPYRQKFVRYVDNRTLKETMLNYVGLTGKDVGRSFALIAGVSQYPNMPEIYRTLPPAAADVEELQSYLVNQEMFDEVVVLKDGDMTADNLRYFMEVYFPDRLGKFPKSRFLFAYSGHGIALGSAADPRGFVLTSAARNFTDTEHAINMATLRLYMDELADAGYQTLALINACHSGVFLRNSFGGGSFVPREPGAHAITAGGSDQRTWSDPHLGRGSIFFEELLAGLGGQADLFPIGADGHHGDGIITVEEIATFLREQVSLNTNQSQTPILTDLKRNGSNGGFFFLNRQRMVARGFIPAWEPRRNTSFGADAEVVLKNAEELYAAGKYAGAFPLFYKAAEAGNGEAARYVGIMYDQGQGTKADEALAVLWDRKSADAEDMGGMADLGFDYEHGTGGLKPDLALAAQWYQRAADGGNTFAMVNLGAMYFAGSDGLPKDMARAASLFRKAAEAGNASGMRNLGLVYETGGGGLPKDLVQAVSWYRKAAEGGDVRGVACLGLMYFNGAGGLPTDLTQAASLFRKAADAGDVTGMRGLGAVYETGGGGLPKDLVQAVSWYRKAANGGDARAMARLGLMYYHGNGGFPKDLGQAASLFRKAADAGDSSAKGFLGSMYISGEGGLPKDPGQAVSWWQKAADEEDARSMSLLGVMYSSDGTGLPQDLKQAAVWFRKGADAGDPFGMTSLGAMYMRDDRGLQRDDAQALSWFQKAADAGDMRGKAYLAAMYEYGLGGLTRDAAKAVSLLRQPAESGDDFAMAHLGKNYEDGTGNLPRDPLQAVSLYQKSADAGNSYGMFLLAEAYENGLGGLKKDRAQALTLYRRAASQGSDEAVAALKKLGQ